MHDLPEHIHHRQPYTPFYALNDLRPHAGYLGPSIYIPWCLYQLAVNPAMVVYSLYIDDGNHVKLTTREILPFVFGSMVVAISGFALILAFMNPSHRRSFWGRLSLREYVAELFDSRTYAPVGSGLDASRAHLLKFSRYHPYTNRRMLFAMHD